MASALNSSHIRNRTDFKKLLISIYGQKWQERIFQQRFCPVDFNDCHTAHFAFIKVTFVNFENWAYEEIEIEFDERTYGVICREILGMLIANSIISEPIFENCHLNAQESNSVKEMF